MHQKKLLEIKVNGYGKKTKKFCLLKVFFLILNTLDGGCKHLF